MTFGSLFAGIGGMDLGLERAGMECRWQVEIDLYCQAVLRKHWPNVPKFGDIKTLTGAELEPVDLIAGGFPCQPVSHNGHQRLTEDERWLWPEFARIVRVLRPGRVLLENVSNLFAAGMQLVASDLASMGYDAEWGCIPASAVGAPQRRERAFIVAYSDRIGFKAGERVFAGLPQSGLDQETWGNVSSRGASGRVLPIPDPAVYGVADGFPSELDAIRAFGNAVVPQVAEFIGRRIMERAA